METRWQLALAMVPSLHKVCRVRPGTGLSLKSLLCSRAAPLSGIEDAVVQIRKNSE